ncbi:MFS transporter [Paenibacillus sp. UMB4589-SE434]|uniref:MFS transporter n=1 Tax=Paenibacillus sp. UMB4589-SE434 TaxID=3046314 RepID=UPI00254F4AEE|nr:MFS transporter [Paenibacillus sp. UMB4589-SE434]MDK8182173.1 MFS transporter [Paenibacillus sp. UMB4589-SE434]
MATLFLVIIYLAFISLGLPDSLLGAAWPVMRMDYGAPIETAGMLYMIIAGGTIVSSLASGTVLKRFGTGKVTFVSCVLTAGALFGFSIAPSLIWLFLCAIPLGLGAGAVDAGLNNYVATHYKAHHMSWLHCFWGVGATIGPMIMSFYISRGQSWRDGYTTIFIIQLALVVLLFCTLPLWKRVSPESRDERTDDGGDTDPEGANEQKARTNPLKIKGVKLTLTSFLLYCGVESTVGLWGGSFLVNTKQLTAATAAQWVSLYYAGITVGRLITGFVTFKVSNRVLIRAGQMIALAGTVLLVLPLPTSFSLVGFIMIGLGCAPIYPCLLHETPTRFGKEQSTGIMGYQMAVAYTGSTFLPPLLGWVIGYSTTGVLPYFVITYIVLMFIGSEQVNRLMKAH